LGLLCRQLLLAAFGLHPTTVRIEVLIIVIIFFFSKILMIQPRRRLGFLLIKVRVGIRLLAICVRGLQVRLVVKVLEHLSRDLHHLSRVRNDIDDGLVLRGPELWDAFHVEHLLLEVKFLAGAWWNNRGLLSLLLHTCRLHQVFACTRLNITVLRLITDISYVIIA
jgi:hypothetical protein